MRGIGTSRGLAIAALLMLAATIVAPAAAQAPGAGQAQSLPAIALTVGGKKLTAEVAATQDQRTIGLMYRFSLKPDNGMLFVFDRPEALGFYMRNTYVPLSIAFLDSEGRILNIEDMAPQTEETHWSKGAALYALEMRKGWFAESGISAGVRVEGLPKPRK